MRVAKVGRGRKAYIPQRAGTSGNAAPPPNYLKMLGIDGPPPTEPMSKETGEMLEHVLRPPLKCLE